MNDVTLDELTVTFALCPEQQRRMARLATARTWADAVHELRVDVRGELDTARLRAALNALPRLHPSLAAGVARVPGFHGWRWCDAGGEKPAILLSIESELLSPEAARERHAGWLAQAFTPGQGPWVGALLIRLAPQHWQLSLAAGVGLVDQAGLQMLGQSLAALYQQPHMCAQDDDARFEQYLEWRAETATDEDAPIAEHYWREQGLTEPAQTPIGRLPYRLGDDQGQPARRVQTTLGEATVVALQRQALALAMSPAQLMQAAWWALLSRVNGAARFHAVWSHDSREDYDYFSSCCGVFEKYLPIALSVPQALPFSEWAIALAGRLNEHVTWQEYWCWPEGAALPAYGFAAVGVAGVATVGQMAWDTRVIPAPHPSLEVALQVQMGDAPEHWVVALDYLPDCYAADCMERLLEQYVELLRGVGEDATVAVAELNLVGDREWARLQALSPRDEAGVAPPLLVQRIEHWINRAPERIVVQDGANALTYGQLGQQVSALAQVLSAQGAGPGQVVAVVVPRSADLLVALLATWWVGAAYVPLDPQWPVARQIQVVDQAKAKWALGDPVALQGLAAHGLGVVDPQSARAVAPSALQACVALQGDESAYVLFTSGSTGVPKGVVVEHRQLANYLASVTETLQLHDCNQFAFTSTVAADLGHTTLFGALYNGGSLHVADEDTMRMPRRFADYLTTSGVDCLKIVPSHLAVLLEDPAAVVPATVVLGGEPPSPALVQRVLQLRPECRLFNHYGPTEATVGVMVHRIESAPGQGTTVPLGQVLAGNQVYVLDARLQPVPLGVMGELHIGGRQLCRGYLDAEAAPRAFVAHPFQPGERLYRTGDLAQYRPDGRLTLLGRADQQIKVNGFRIEPGEIEACLLGFSQVKDVAVISLPGDEPQGGAQPIAFVVLQGDHDQGVASLRTELALQLPAAMLPRRIHPLDRLPRLANGKVDRRALASLEPLEAAGAAEAPRDPLEQLLAQRMARLLGRAQLGINHDFFTAGGHSLLAIKLVAGLRKLLKTEVSPAIVFDHPTVSALAGAIRALPGVAPEGLDTIVQAALRLDALTPEARAALEEKARQLRNPAR